MFVWFIEKSQVFIISYSVHIDIEERVSVAANKDGGLEQMEVRGVLTLKIADPSSARISLALKASDDASIQFKTHPNVDKNAWKDQHIVQMRDLSRPFPANQNLEVVRWKLSTRDETAVPLTSKLDLELIIAATLTESF